MFQTYRQMCKSINFLTVGKHVAKCYNMAANKTYEICVFRWRFSGSMKKSNNILHKKNED